MARLTHTQSEFGVQFDSIADMTAFGVAPALVMYKFCLYTLGGLGWAAAFVYCLCAGVRLARFNCNVGVVDKRFFQGLPSPAAAALLAGFVWLAVENKMPTFLGESLPWLAFVLTIYAGLTMVCNAPFYSGKSGVSLKNAPFIVMVAGALAFILISSNPPLAIFTIFCVYALSGYAYQLWLFISDKPNPVLPGEYTVDFGSSEPESVAEAGPDFPEEEPAETKTDPSARTERVQSFSEALILFTKSRFKTVFLGRENFCFIKESFHVCVCTRAAGRCARFRRKECVLPSQPCLLRRPQLR